MSAESQVDSFGIYGHGLPDFRPGFLHYERIEDQLPFHGWSARPHRHEGLDQILFFTHGSGVLLLEGSEQAFDAPALMVMPAGTVHGFVFQQTIRAPILTVARSLFEAALSGLDAGVRPLLSQPGVLDLRAEPRRLREIRFAFDLVAHEYPGDDPGRQQVLLSALNILLTAIGRVQARGPRSEDNRLYAAFLQAIEADYRRQPQVPDFARALGISTSRLSQICRAQAGRSPQELLHERLLTEARRMLLYTNHSATAISYMLGFREPAYFNRFFKRLTAMTPGAFRAALMADGADSA